MLAAASPAAELPCAGRPERNDQVFERRQAVIWSHDLEGPGDTEWAILCAGHPVISFSLK